MKLEIHPENKDFSWSIPEGPYKFLSNKQAQQFNKDGTSPANSKYTFDNVWPVNVAPIDLDWGTNDTIEEFTVEWAYDWWSNSVSADL